MGRSSNCGRRCIRKQIGVVAIICLIAPVLLAGCSGTSSAGAEATGVITLDGTPLPNAFISLIPKGSGSSAYATSDDQGNFTVNSSGSVTGLAPGEYVVVVEQGEASADESAESESAGVGEASSGNSIIPKKYLNEGTSDLTVTVSEGEQTSLTLELSSAE